MKQDYKKCVLKNKNQKVKIKFLSVVLLFISFVSFSQIVNEGILKIKDGTTVYFAEEFTNKVGATHNNEGNLHLNSNLINNGTMTESVSADAANGTTYFNSPTNATATVNAIQTITGTTKVVFENMVVNMTDATSQGVSVADGLELIVENAVTLTDSDLRLIGEAQLIQKQTSTNANSGLGKLLRDQQGTVDTYNYNYWSSPVSGATANTYQVGEVLFDGSDANFNATTSFSPQQATFSTGSPWNGAPSTLTAGVVTTALDVESYWIWKFENGDIDDDDDWVLMRDNTAFEAGLGFTMKGAGASTANQNFVFKGLPNDGNYSFTIGAVKSFMLGNPYPCALDADEFITDNSTVLADVTTPSSTTGAIYYWEHWGGNSHVQQNYQGGYATYTLAGGTPPTSHPDVNNGGFNSGINGSQYVPVAQGFFVESTSGGTINFKNSQRVFKTEGADSYFRRPNNINTSVEIRKSSEDEDTMQRVRLGYNAPSGFYRQIMTAFVPETNDGHNTAYDARMAYVHNDEMYWVTNNIPYVIDARPYAINKQLPIGINVAEAGLHKIYLFEAENFDGDLYILDTNTGYTHDIRQNDFEVNLEVGNYIDRFKLVFQPQSPLDISDLLSESLQVFYANSAEDVVIKNPTNLSIKDIKIFNAIGQLVKQVAKNKFISNNEIRIPFQVTSGTYFIQIESDIGKGGFKIIAH